MLGLILFISLSLFTTGSTPQSNKPNTLQLAMRFKKSTYCDFSHDGRLIILYGARTPEKKIGSKGVVEWQPKRSDKYLDILRVVEIESGREIGTIHVHKFGLSGKAGFIPNSKKVLYTDGTDYKLWDYQTGQVENAEAPKSFQPGLHDKKVIAPNGKMEAEAKKEEDRRFLWFVYVKGVVYLYRNDSQSKVEIGRAIHPTVKEPYDWPLTGNIYRLAFGPRMDYLATSYERDTYLWRVPKVE